MEVDDEGILYSIHDVGQLQANLAEHNHALLHSFVNVSLAKENAFFNSRTKLLMFLIEDTSSVKKACDMRVVLYPPFGKKNGAAYVPFLGALFLAHANRQYISHCQPPICDMHFGMFTGKEEKVTLEFENSLVGAVIDRFGKDIAVIPSDGERFRIQTDVAVSPQFFGWLCAFGKGVCVIAPENVVEQMKRHVDGIAELYADA